MRRQFHPILLNYMRKDPRIFVITADLGYKMFDAINDEFQDRFINVGAAEVTMLGVAIGLAESGKIPVCYSITPFLLKRPFEMIDNYLNNELANVKLCGGGRDNDYSHDGYSHDASSAKSILSCWPNIVQFWPESTDDLPNCFDKWIYSKSPSFLSLRR